MLGGSGELHALTPVRGELMRRGNSLLLLFSHSVGSDSSAAPWAIAHQAPLSMGFSRQERWSASPFPPPGDLLYPGIELASPALAGGFFTAELPGNPDSLLTCGQIFFAFFFFPL